MATATERTCRAKNKRGERCKARAVERGLCAAHAGLVDMQAIGRKGGKVRPLTRLRARADDTLREQARDVLSRALSGDQVDKAQLDAARSLFSYRASEAPARDRERSEGVLVDGKRVTSLTDVVAFAAKIGHAPPDLVAACRGLVEAAEQGPSELRAESLLLSPESHPVRAPAAAS
jgi:hypothetical protein